MQIKSSYYFTFIKYNVITLMVNTLFFDHMHPTYIVQLSPLTMRGGWSGLYGGTPTTLHDAKGEYTNKTRWLPHLRIGATHTLFGRDSVSNKKASEGGRTRTRAG